MQTYQIIVFLLFFASQAYGDDWTSSCPTNCTCKWSNGKKSVICNALELTEIPTTLSTEIQVLVLNENQINNLDCEAFTSLGLINLQRIYLKKSHVEQVHRDAFKNLLILIEIDLSENQIETLDKNTFNGNDRLRILYLNGNPLKMLQAYQFPVLPHLRSLDLHNCQINNIDSLAFANLELLELINLKNNLLENLPESLFQYMRNLKTLILDGNPWRCDCHLRNFRTWYGQNYEKGASLQCTQPLQLRTKLWSNIDEIEFGCQPTVDVYSDDIFNVDIGSNVTLSCLIYGDPLPTITWELNGRDIINDNVLTEDETIYGNKLWRNITILNITNYDAGIYVCTAKNNIGLASRNISIYLTEIVQHVIEKGPETFWYFGLILGTFGTVFCLITISFVVCICKKTTQRRRGTIKTIKGSVSFNDQEKKLLDLSITTNDRQDSGEQMATATSTVKQEPVIALEPVQITIENLSRNDEYPMNVGVFTPPPEFCSNANPAYGNIFISVALTQDVIDNPEQMYPDLLNIPNRVIGKLFPINVSSYATLPRNRHQRTGSLGSNHSGTMKTNGTPPPPPPPSSSSSLSSSSTAGTTTSLNRNQHHHQHLFQSTIDSKNAARLQNVINYQNLDTTTTRLNENASIGLCTGCLKKQDNNKSHMYPIKYDNMGRRITASGNSTLSIPDEEKEISFCATQNICNDNPTPPPPPPPSSSSSSSILRNTIDTVNISNDMSTVSATCLNACNGASTSKAAIISGTFGLNATRSSNCKSSGHSDCITANSNVKSNSKLSDRNSTRMADDKMRDIQETILPGCDYVSL